MRPLEERSERVRDVIHATNQRLERLSWYEACLLTYGAIQIIREIEREEKDSEEDCPF